MPDRLQSGWFERGNTLGPDRPVTISRPWQIGRAVQYSWPQIRGLNLKLNVDTPPEDLAQAAGSSPGSDAHSGAAEVPSVRGRRRRMFARWARRLILLPLAVLLVFSTAAFFLLRGQEFDSAAIGSRVQGALQELLGDNYRVSVGGAGLSLRSASLLALSGRDVVVTLADGGGEVARFEQVGVGLDPLSLVSGTPRFDQLTISKGSITRLAVMEDREGGNSRLPARPSVLLSALGESLGRAENLFAEGAISSIRIADVTLAPAVAGMRGAMTLETAEVSFSSQGNLGLAAKAATAFSNAAINANWSRTSEGGRQLSIGAGPVSAREWLAGPDPAPDARGVGSDSLLRVDARIPFAAVSPEADPVEGSLIAQQPVIRIQADSGRLRIGPRQVSELRYAVLNFRIYPGREQIELERSQLSIGNVSMDLLGGIRPLDPETGYSGPLEAELIGEEILVKALSTDDKPVAAAFRLHGISDPSGRNLQLNEILLKSGEGDLAGRGNLSFADAGPGLSLSLASERITTGAVRHLWPFFLAPNPREWFRENTFGGEFAALSIDVDLVPGRLGEVARGDAFHAGEFLLSTAISGVRVDLPGELPPLRSLSGALAIAGERLQLTADDARAFASDGGEVEVETGSFTIADLFAPVPVGSLEIALSGPARAMALIADAKPLEVARRALIDPEALSGEAEARVTAGIFLAGEREGNAEAWVADIRLMDASSSKPVFGRKVSKADLLIHADASAVKVTGPATIDGIEAELAIIEPLGVAPREDRDLRITASTNASALAAQGIALAPVIDGRLKFAVTVRGNEQERFEVDLTNADLALPWVGWLKGAGIPARATFNMDTADGITTISNLELRGEGFGARGKLVVSRNGLVAADLTDVSLNRGDDFAVTVSSRQRGYDIAASGQSFDARAILNLLIHSEENEEAATTADLSLTANFGTVLGFSGRRLENTVIRYEENSGRIDMLAMRGSLSGATARIDARRDGERTRFDFSSGNAGDALAMVALYPKMQGGTLSATMIREGDGPYSGRVVIEDFIVENEERLKSIVAAPATDRVTRTASGELQKINVQRVRFDDLVATLEKGEGWLNVEEGRIRNDQIGLTFEGTLYNEAEEMNVRGTFMPLFTLSRLVSLIPLVGDILSNGEDSGLIGITYQLKGASRNPAIAVNPISVMAPGIFRKIFEFRE